MAKNYKRHSTGGRFKRADIGDAGIRSLKEQQRDIIDSIKVRAAQDKEISNQQISGFDRASSKELENRQTLKNLEDQIFQNKAKNIKVRAGNEIDRLEGQAKELGKKSEFWKNFSTTYSRQLLQAAQQTIDFKDRLWADKQMDSFIEEYPKLIKFKSDYLLEGGHSLLDKQLIEASSKTNLDNEEGKEANKEVLTNLRVSSRTNRYLDARKVAQIKEDINAFEKNLKQTIDGDDRLKWNASTIPGHYLQAAKNLIRKAEIKPNSEAAQELISLFVSKGTAAQSAQNLRDKAYNDKLLVEEKIEDVKAANNLKRPNMLYQYVAAVKSSTIKLAEGKYKEPERNFAIARINAATTIADRYIDEDKFVKDFQSMEVENPKKDPNKPLIPWSERYTDDGAQVRDENTLRQIWKDAHTERKAALDLKEKVNHELALGEVSTKLLDPKFNLNKEGLAEINNIANKYGGGGEDVQNLIKTAEVFDFGSRSKYFITKRLTDEWSDGNYNDFYDLYGLVDSETKTIMLGLKEDLDEQRNASWNKNGKGILPHAESKVKEIMKTEQVLGTSTGDAGDIVTAYKAEFQMQLEALKDTIPDINKRGIEARDRVDKMLKEKEGIFRRTGEGGSTIWLAFTKEPQSADEKYTDAELEDELTQTPGARRRNVNKLIENHKNGTRFLVPQDTTDSILFDITNGKSVTIPPVLEKLYKINPGKHGTIEDFVNDILGTKIPISVESRNKKLEKEKYSLMRIPNKELYSKNDLAAIHAVMYEFDTWPTSLEFQAKLDEYGGLDYIDIDADPLYNFLNDPARDYSRYY